ncbi:hypothetical protein HDU97_007431 [Phlyctochytrium planicorne]|nr:hypothetical protein HDU97_007431 [Phlyctochytrium planicorne]
MLIPSPSRDLAQFAVLEDKFCKDFKCCGISLENLHDLLHHFEESHVKVDSEFGDDDDLPFDFMDEDLDHEEDHAGPSSFEEVGKNAAQLSFADLAFIRAQVASMERRDVVTTFEKKESHGMPSVHLPTTIVNAPLQQLSMRGNKGHTSTSNSNVPASTATPSSLLALQQPSTNAPVTMSDIYVSSRNKHHIEVDEDDVSMVDERLRAVEPKTTETDVSGDYSRNWSSQLDSKNKTLIVGKATSALGLGLVSSEKLQADLPELDQKPSFQRRSTAPEGNPKPFIDKDGSEESIRHHQFFGLPPSSSSVSMPNIADYSIEDPDVIENGGNSRDSGSGSLGNESDDGSGNREDRPYRCRMNGCSKAYKNPGGLKYHMMHGHAEDTGDPEINNIIQKPYLCPVASCEKRYKNLNGLKYHIEHAHSSLLEA